MIAVLEQKPLSELLLLINQRRKSLKLSKRKLAQMTRLHPNTLTRILSPHGRPAFQTVLDLAHAVGLDLLLAYRAPD